MDSGVSISTSSTTGFSTTVVVDSAVVVVSVTVVVGPGVGSDSVVVV